MKILYFAKTGVLFSLLALTMISPVKSQIIQEIMGKLDLYMQKYPEENVYVQTDRSTYSPGDILWLKANIMQDAGKLSYLLSHYLFISLIDKDSLEVVNHILPISKSNLYASLPIPRLISPGYYKLIAYTSWMKNTPVDRIFSKEIYIEEDLKHAFTIDIKLKDTISLPNSTLTAGITCMGNDLLPLSVPFTFRLTNSKGDLISGKGKTDKTGKALITAALPDFTEAETLKLLVNASYKGNSTDAGVIIPTSNNYFNVLFYPEGGMLLYGIETRIAFRAFNQADRPVDFKGKIITGQQNLVKTTGSSYQGIGSLYLTPEKGQTYYLRITHPTGITKTFKLPDPRRSGVAMRVESKTADTLSLAFAQTGIIPHSYHFIGQMKGKVYWQESRKTSGSTRLKIPLHDFPAGVAEFTAFDSLKNLLAKRLVFINEMKQLNIDIKTDKMQYLPREKVTITIQAADAKGNPVEADLSLSVANAGSGDLPDNHDFITHTTMRSDLIGYLPTPQQYLNEKQFSGKILDELLIANAFKRFTWRMVLEMNERNPSFTSMEENGSPSTNIAYDKNVAAYFAQELSNSTQSPGKSFVIYPANNMERILHPDKAEANPGMDYTKMKDVLEIVYNIKPYKMLDNKIIFHSIGPTSLYNQQGAAIAIDGVYHGTDPTILSTVKPMDIDRVMVSTNPIDIQRYTGLNAIGIIEIFTKSANPSLRIAETNKVETNDANLNREFESPSYEKGSDSQKSGSDNRKTIYWNPDIHIDDSGRTVVSFFNGDIPSEVIVQVEGRSLNGENLLGSKTATYTVK